LERLVRKGVRVQLSGRVRVEPGEEQKALAADLHHRVLHNRRLRVSGLQESPHAPLVALRLRQVLAVGRREVWVSGDVRRGPELGQRLLLDRMRIGQVLRQLFRELAHALGLPLEAALTPANAVSAASYCSGERRTYE